MLYHVSQTAGLKSLSPHPSTHQTPYVYAVENMVTGFLFGAEQDDFDLRISTETDGKPIVMECYPDAFRTAFFGKTCTVYEVEETDFLRGKTAWSAEFVSEKEVAVVREIPVEDLYARLLQEEANGKLTVHRWEDTAEYKRVVSAHIVDRLIRFGAVDTENSRLKKHYGRLIDALQSILDGHLL